MRQVNSDSNSEAWDNYKAWVRSLYNVPEPETYEDPNAGKYPWN